MGTWDLGEKTAEPFLFAFHERSAHPMRYEPREYFYINQFANGVSVSAVRPQDLVSLTFEALGFEFYAGLRSGYPYLRKRKGTQGRLRVVLPPQHLAEEAHAGSGSPSVFAKHCLSRPSILAFKVRKGKEWRPRIWLEELLRWEELHLLVHPRASSLLNGDVAKQLSVAFGSENLEKLNYKAAIKLIGSRIEGPGAGQTSLELNGRMIFSPSEKAGWLHPPEPAWPWANAPLWSLLLDDIGRTSLRAVYSRQLGKGFPSSLANAGEPPFLQTLTFRQQWEILAQTSVPGIPALRRLDKTDVSGGAGSANSDKPEVPQSGVVRPRDRTIKFLDDIDKARGFEHEDAGIALVTPFERAMLRMTALGATFEGLWKGNPARVLHSLGSENSVSGVSLPPGFDLERLQINTWLGRDIEVVAVEKGFLFPLGMPASLVTIHERRIFTIDEQPVSMLYRHQFISCSDKPRSYPGPYQPFDGREFPARSVTMHTLVTPTLEKTIANIPWKTGEVWRIRLDDEAIFWPRVTDQADAHPKDFVFEWSTQDAPRVCSHLLFVKNKEVGREEVMEALVEYYEDELDGTQEYLKRAWLDGARHSYAPAGDKPGSTSFDTVYWQLGARGRYNTANNVDFFRMDGLMEGADQPPFYPVMRKAEIAIQSLNQMMGTPKGTTGVSYYDGYIAHGMDQPVADGLKSPEIFLTVDKSIKFDSSKRANRSGGIASPDVNIAALSRSIGLVGGRENTTPPGVTDKKLKFSSAAEGRFDPAQFFDEAELLGLFPLTELLDMKNSSLGLAPRLIEEVVDGTSQQALATVRQLAKALLEALYGRNGSTGLMNDLKDEIQQLPFVSGGITEKLNQLYPKLGEKLIPFLPLDPPSNPYGAKVAQGLERLALEGDIPAIKELSLYFKEAVQAIQQVIRDPVPDIFQKQMTLVAHKFEGAINTARGFVNDTAMEFEKALVKALKDALSATISADDGYGRILFGAHSINSDELFARPAQVLERAGRSVLATGLEQIFAHAEPFLARAMALQLQLSWEVGRIEQAVLEALEEAIAAISDQLASYADQDDDIRNPTWQGEFKSKFTQGIGERLGVNQQPQSDLREALGKLRARLQKVEEYLTAQICAQREAIEKGIYPQSDVNKETLLKQLLAGLQESIRRRIGDPVVAELEAMLERIYRELQADSGLQIRAVEQNIIALLNTVIESKEMVVIARIGQTMAGMCDAATAAAKSAFNELLGDAAQVTLSVEAFYRAASDLVIPQDDLFDEARRARGRVVQIAARIVNAEASLKQARTILADRTDHICSDPREWLELVTNIVEQKYRIAEGLQHAAQDLRILQRQGSSSSLKLAGQVDEAVRQAAAIQLELMGIAGLMKPNNDAKLIAAIAQIRTDPKSSVFADRVENALDKAHRLATKISADISEIDTNADRLEAVSRCILSEFIKTFEQDLAGSILQTVAFPKLLIDSIEMELTKPLAALAQVTASFYELAGKSTQTFIMRVLEFGQLEDPADRETVLAIIYRIALGVGNADEFRTCYFQPITDAQIALPGEKDRIAAINAATTEPELRAVSALFRSGSDNQLPQSVLLALFRRIRALTRFESGEDLVAQLREMLRNLERRLRDLATQFVPAKLTTSYTWGAKLKKFPEDWRFCPGEANAAGHHLTIEGTYSFDLISQTQTVKIKGELQPCTLWLLGRQLDMLTIHLGKMTFESVNGAKPTFDVDITSVKVGKFLSYIEALQDWLAPKGSGFYIKPAEKFLGVEAGYKFASGLIQVGNLQFINVSFTASVTLPFSKPKNSDETGAVFKLALAEPGAPFLVAAPPYGGGGWIVMEASRQSQTSSRIAITNFSVSIVFGGVAAIRFGPLRANGSILAGIRVDKKGDGPYKFTALFHAVGEGSVACFSVCVSLRVQLTQHASSLYGHAEFSFSFKVGIAKFRYKVIARYKLKNSKKANSAALASASAARTVIQVTNPGWWSTDAPRKGTNWADYRRYVDIDILKEAA